MPATEKTWRNQRRLHVIFGVTGLLLLLTTVWMLGADHVREWKSVQRTARDIDVSMLQMRMKQELTVTQQQLRKQLERQLSAARSKPLDPALISEFKEEVRDQDPDHDFGQLDAQLTRLQDLAGKAEQARTDWREAEAAKQAALAVLADKQIALRDAEQKLTSAADRQAAVSAVKAAEEARDAASDAADDAIAAAQEAREEADAAELAAIEVRNDILRQLRDIARRARYREDRALAARKDAAAQLDKVKADHGLAIRDGETLRAERLQERIDELRDEVAARSAAYDAAKLHRRKLQQFIREMTDEEEEITKRLEELNRDLKRLESQIAERRAAWFRWGMPPLGKKWLELPIVDAFNSPLEIKQIWLPDLTFHNNFRDVARFDRCTTCHLSIDKTAPGSPSKPGYPHAEEIFLDISTPSQSTLARIEARLLQAKRDGEIEDDALTLEAVYGFQLASEGLVNDQDVTVSLVQQDSFAARAVLAQPGAGRPKPAKELRELVLFNQLKGDPEEEDGLRLGDVITAVAGDPVRTPDEVRRALLDRGRWNTVVRLTVRRGLPHPYASHPRLDLFVGSLSPHKKMEMGCTICHEGQGSGTSFKWTSHAPNTPLEAKEWAKEYGWFDNHHWIYPMHPKRFLESNCVRCHHEVSSLKPSERFPEPPAPKLTKGHDLIQQYGCFGCHEINGYEGPQDRIGPDLRLEPNYYTVGLDLKHLLDKPESAKTGEEPPEGAASDDPVAAKIRDLLALADRVAMRPEDNEARTKLRSMLLRDKARADAQTRAQEESKDAAQLEKPIFPPQARALADRLEDVDTPGTLRKVGPSLRYVNAKLGERFLYDWIQKPSRFRPDTKMPQFFGLWDHLKERGRKEAERYEPVEIHGIIAYLKDRSQRFEPLTLPSDKEQSDAKELVARGKNLFQMRGCLACHEHEDFPPPTGAERADFGPDLSNIGDKLAADDAEQATVWLRTWLRNPSHYSARTLMPNMKLEPFEEVERAPDGTVKSRTTIDPVKAIAAYLMQSKSGWEPITAPEISEAAIDDLAMVYLTGKFSRVKSEDYLEEGIPLELRDELKGFERELLGDLTQLSDEEKRQRKLIYVGAESISRYGCYACHDIPGYEDAKPIGTALADWGRKDPSKLAFENILQYVGHGHGHGGHGSGHTGEDHGGSHDSGSDHSDSKDASVFEEGEYAAERDRPRRTRPYDGGVYAEDEEYPPYYMMQLESHNRIGFAYQKLREPRSYDYMRTGKIQYNERLRMPMFPFDNSEREAVITFLLGLVADPPPSQFVYNPPPERQAIVDGETVLAKFNCASCHVLDLPKWEVTWQPKADGERTFRAPGEWEDYPFLKPHFPPEKVEASTKSDRRGFLSTTVEGYPSMEEDGLPTLNVFNRELEEFVKVDEATRFRPEDLFYTLEMWQPTLINGEVYTAGRLREMVKYDSSNIQHPYINPIWLEGLQHGRGGDFARRILPILAAEQKKGAEAWGWVPPPLIDEGQKVQTEWLHDFLLEPYSIRPAAVLQMPKFNMSSAEATALASYFAAKDEAVYPFKQNPRRESSYLAREEAAYRQLLKQQGREGSRFDHAMGLLQEKTVGCSKCHIIGGYDPGGSPLAKGPDLAEVYKRLRPEYVRRWVANPKLILPYTGMPVVIPYSEDPQKDGFAIMKEGQRFKPLEGDSQQQLRGVVDLLMNFDRYAIGQQTSGGEPVADIGPGGAEPDTEKPAAERPADGEPAAEKPPQEEPTEEKPKPEDSVAKAPTTPVEPKEEPETPPIQVDGDWGTLKGRFTYGGTAPQLAPVKPTKDLEACGKAQIPDERLVVGPDGGLRDVLVELYVRRGGESPKVHPAYQQAANSPVVLDNKQCVFEPHVALLWTEQKLRIKNSDPVAHNAKIDTLNQDPINPLLPPGTAADYEFEEPERLPAGVSCSIHPWMKAYLVVKDHPYMAVSDKNGNFELKNIPAGEWTFRFWHPTSGYVRKVTVDGQPTEWKFGRLTLDVQKGETDLGEIKVDPSIFKLD